MDLIVMQTSHHSSQRHSESSILRFDPDATNFTLGIYKRHIIPKLAIHTLPSFQVWTRPLLAPNLVPSLDVDHLDLLRFQQ